MAIFDPMDGQGGMMVVPQEYGALGIPEPPVQPSGGLFALPRDNTLGILGAHLLMAGAPTTDPGGFQKAIAAMVPALATERQRQAQQAQQQQQMQMQRTRLELAQQQAAQPVGYAPGTQLRDPQTGEVVGQVPRVPKRTSRDLPMEGGLIQKQESYDGGQTWQNVGAPYLRRDPYKQVMTVDPETGRVEQGFVDVRTLPSGQPQVTEGVETPEGAAVVEQTGPTIIGVGQKPPTESQRKSRGYYDRMVNAGEILDRLDEEGTSTWGKFLENTPGGIGNYLQSPEYQMFDQARRDFINAQLREESGAVISMEEFRNANRQYFPQPGDSPEVIKQKAENRRTAIESMRRASGAEAGEPQAPPPPPPGFQVD